MSETSTLPYLYGVVNEEQRNMLQHLALQSVIQKLLVEIVDNYGLGQRLKTALNNHSKVLILEAGSGSGSLLHDFADLLDERGLLPAADLNGIDLNGDYVSSAEQKNNQKPTWRDINYYQHDVTEPLSHNFSLKLENKLQYDCICATLLIQYLPNARQHVLDLYNYLKPGGVLYLCDSYMSYEGPQPWIAPNPTMERFGRVATKLVRDLNGGQIVAQETAGWLREAGAEQVQTTYDPIQVKGGDARSIEILRYYIAIVRNVAPVLFQLGLISQAQLDEFLSSIFQIDRTSFAQLPFIHTLARKPTSHQ